ncbi:MAG: twin-arginine translocase TatA/TatE family subunit [Deltaproteobacteria bacterium]|jgi:sec-independent protein translocase protein TatB|nr:twin-arginine translocase TatA/TatE family subunit [Deltaproteobacteria bacterium]MBK7066933.1 twin-arginine translocase TatA/TatE family subunit [Deltaproteobacteria bacterium]MBK8695848.1 twin-arginine translocase TatA/TatE family subunit [Deltaproteobacteria bacterium]MBP6831811.1 twin-arginine translocase TatA/TatE family subunit [Deltaproteobacteria bacterium]TAK31951.1 MAG: twin-arginine translocase TatA/TatE family subunit [Myxococcaceae bacterium]
MFGIGLPELFLIGLVALVVVGPKNLPQTLRAIGRAVREFQRASRELRQEAGFDEVVDEVTRPLREGLSGIEEGVRSTVDDAKRSMSLEAEAESEAVDLAMEYPEGGPDDFGALPEGAAVYPETEGAP